AAVVVHYTRAPYGEWDAWAIWNQKARLMLRGGHDWTPALRIPWSKPGHPWLVSSAVARLWAYAGEETTLAPALLAGVFGTSIVMGVMGALATRGTWAWMAAIVVMSPSVFAQLASAQTADLPVGAFVMLSLASLSRGALVADRDAPRYLAAAGLLGALAAWTKNEGVVFVLASGVLASVALARQRRSLEMRWWAAGAAPVILMVLWFKLAIAPDVPPYGAEQPQTLEAMIGQMLSPAEHLTIVGLMGHLAPLWGGPWARGSLLVMLAAAVAGAWPGASPTARFVLAVVGVMSAGYYATI